MKTWIGNIIFVVYTGFAALALAYIAVSCWNYHWIMQTFHKAPGNDELYELLRNYKGKNWLTSNAVGNFLLAAYAISILVTPVVLLLHFISNRLFRRIPFKPNAAVVIGIVYLTSFGLLYVLEGVGWYMGFLLD